MSRKVLPEGLVEFILEHPDTSIAELYEVAQKKFDYESSWMGFRVLVYRTRKRNSVVKQSSPKKRLESSDLLNILTSRGHVKLIELCKLFSCSPKKVEELISMERRKGHEVLVEDDYVFLSDGSRFVEPRVIKKPLESKEIVFGVASDLHFGSKACQITALNEFAEDCKREGVQTIFSPGDLLAGYKVYKGQQYELYELEAEGQEASLVRNLPKGFEWYVIGGNHDHSFMKNGGGHNALSVIDNQRPDVHYLGFTEAVVPILPGSDLMMWHPRGAACYAMSYKLQKFIEQRAFQELQKIINGIKSKPTLRFVLCGHYHIQLQATFGSIFGMMAGSFEGSNSLTKEKGWVPAIGGWIVRAWIKKDGTIDYSPKWYSKPEIEDDYKNYRHDVENESKIEKPIFG